MLSRNVQPRLNGQSHARLQQAPFIIDFIVTDIMHIHAQPVAGAVHIIFRVIAIFDQLRQFALEQAELEQTFGQCFHRRMVRIIPVVARPDLFYRLVLGGQHHIINFFLGFTVTAIHRKAAGNIRRITAEFRARINQHDVTVAHRFIVLGVMQNTAIGTTADNRRVGPAGAIAVEFIEQLGLQLIFIFTRTAGFHGINMGLHRNFCRLAHQLNFFTAFEQTHIVQQMVQRNEFIRRMHAAA